MKKFLAGFQVDTEHKELAGVCAGLGNYFNIQANLCRREKQQDCHQTNDIGLAMNPWEMEQKKLETKLFSCLLFV